MLLLSAALALLALVDRLLRHEADERRHCLERVHAAAFELLVGNDGAATTARVEAALSRIASVIGADCIWIDLGNAAEGFVCWCSGAGPTREMAAAITARITQRFPWIDDMILVAPNGRHAFTLRSMVARRRSTPLSSLLLRSSVEGKVAMLAVHAVGGRLHLRPEMVQGLAAALLIVVQIAHQRSLQMQKISLERKLALGRRMETVGALASGIAHNLNNILNAVEGFRATAVVPHASERVIAASLEGIGQATARGAALVADMLRFGRRLEGPPELVDVHEMLDETRKLLSASLPSNVRLAGGEATDQMVQVTGDFGDLQQVMLNLCSNAAKAMPGGGTISWQVAPRELDDPVRLSHGVLRRGRYVTIIVSDEGHGVTDEAAAHLFDAFYTTRPDGTGLGLSTAREIVERHGGAIDVDSVVGVGSTFTIWLPLAETSTRPSSEPRLARGDGEIVMLINPDPARLSGDEELLAALGYEPLGVVADDRLAFDDLIGTADVILVACLDPLLAARIAAAAQRATVDAPVIVAVPQPNCRESSLRYPFRPVALAHALARCLDHDAPSNKQRSSSPAKGGAEADSTPFACRSVIGSDGRRGKPVARKGDASSLPIRSRAATSSKPLRDCAAPTRTKRPVSSNVCSRNIDVRASQASQ